MTKEPDWQIIVRLQARIARLEHVLGLVLEYLDDRQDCDDGIPNDAMRLLVQAMDVLRK